MQYVTPCPVGTIRQSQGLNANNNPYIDCIMTNDPTDLNNTTTINNLTSEQMILDVCPKFGGSSYVMNTNLITGEYECLTRFGGVLDQGKINISFANQSVPTVPTNSPTMSNVTNATDSNKLSNVTNATDSNTLSNITNLMNEGKIPLLDAKFPLANANFKCDISPLEGKVICTGKNNNGDLMVTYEVTNIPGPGPEMKYEFKVIPSESLYNQNTANSTSDNLMINSVSTNMTYEVCRNDNCVPLSCTIWTQNGQVQNMQDLANTGANLKNPNILCVNTNNVAQRVPSELTIPHKVDPECNNSDGTCEMEICTLDDNKLTCLPYGAPAKFTNVYEFKSKKERKVENFSQNNKCKARY